MVPQTFLAGLLDRIQSLRLHASEETLTGCHRVMQIIVLMLSQLTKIIVNSCNEDGDILHEVRCPFSQSS